MRRRTRFQQPKPSRVFSLRVEDLEGRQLLSTGLAPVTNVVATASPVAIGRVVTAPLSATGTGSTGFASGSGAITPFASGTTSAPYSPSVLRHAYGVDQLPYDGTGQTIAIVDAYADTTIQSDLAAFDAQFSLPTAKLTVVTPPTQNGGVAPADPSGPTGWPLETALDVEWVHSIAPGANILLVQAASPSYTNLLGAVTYAVGQGANEVSMSWGGGDSGSDASFDSTFANHPGVSFFASSGDSGAGVEYPAASPYVTAVGGTTLNLDSSGNRTSETVWSGSGGGLSSYETKPAYQTGFVSGTKEGVPDVSYDADPSTGVYVDDNATWYQVGGTSAGAPQWAALVALANQGRAANGLKPVGYGVTGGTNAVLYGLAGGTGYTNAGGDFTDITSGSNGTNSNAAVGWDPATGLGSPVANKLIPDLAGKAATPTPPTVGDASFEAVSVGSGTYTSYSYDPTGSAWAFTSSAGLAGNGSGFTSGNPSAPQGSQVAFLQVTGSFTQSIANWTAGNYQLSFAAAQRGNQFSQEDFQLLIDGTVVATFMPSGTSYQTYTTPSFSVAAGTHSITFKGLNTVGGDNTALIDSVAVGAPSQVVTPTPAPASVGDASFEAVSVGSGTYTSYSYDPTGSAWAFTSSAGLAGNGSGFTSANPSAPQGSQVAFLQVTGSFTQSIANWTAGNYQLSFAAAQRGNQFSQEDFQLLIDGTVVATFMPSGTSYQTYTTPSFSVAAGTHSITFKGLNTVGGDNTALIDSVTLTSK